MGKRRNYIPQKQQSKYLLQLQERMAYNADKAEIYQVYNKFKNFMNWDEAPEFLIDIYKKEDGDFATTIPPSKDNLKYILRIYHEAKVRRQYDYNALLYHEFTHIYDYESFRPYLVDNGAEGVFSWYSEVNAVVISLMQLCNYQNINDNKQMELSNEIWYRNRKITLDDYFSKAFSEIELRMKEGNYDNILKKMQYYIGCFRFYCNYCTYQPLDYIRLLKTDFWIKYFEINLTRMMETLSKFDLSLNAINEIVIFEKCLLRKVAKEVLAAKKHDIEE